MDIRYPLHEVHVKVSGSTEGFGSRLAPEAGR